MEREEFFKSLDTETLDNKLTLKMKIKEADNRKKIRQLDWKISNEQRAIRAAKQELNFLEEQTKQTNSEMLAVRQKVEKVKSTGENPAHYHTTPSASQESLN